MCNLLQSSRDKVLRRQFTKGVLRPIALTQDRKFSHTSLSKLPIHRETVFAADTVYIMDIVVDECPTGSSIFSKTLPTLPPTLLNQADAPIRFLTSEDGRCTCRVAQKGVKYGRFFSDIYLVVENMGRHARDRISSVFTALLIMRSTFPLSRNDISGVVKQSPPPSSLVNTGIYLIFRRGQRSQDHGDIPPMDRD